MDLCGDMVEPDDVGAVRVGVEAGDVSLVRVLVCGFGSAGRRHAKNARELGHEVVVIETDDTARAEANDAGFKGITPDLYRFRGVEPGAAVIATPAATHLPVAKQLKDAGYAGPLFVEKPIDVETTCNDWWMQWPCVTRCVGYNWRFVKGVREARGAGEVVTVTRTDMSLWPGATYAGELLECSHDLDLHRWLSGQRDFIVDYDDGEWIIWGDPKEPCIGEIAPHAAAPRRSLRTEKGYIYNLCTDEEIAVTVEPSYRAEMEAFLDAAEKGEPVAGAATFEDGLAVLRIVEEAERLAAQQKDVTNEN